MPENMEDGEFRLPSEFLPEDFFLGEENTTLVVVEPKDTDGLFFHSKCFDNDEPLNLNFPINSTTETESDSRSYTDGLTRQMTHAFLLDDEEQNIRLSTSPVFFSTQNIKKSMAISPQSPLCSTVEWTKLSTMVSFSPFHEQDIDKDNNESNSKNKNNPNNDGTRAWEDLLFAAGHAVRMRREGILQEEVELQKRRTAHHLGILGFNGPASKPPLSSIYHMNNTIRYYGNPALTHHQLQVSQLKHQQMLKQRQQHLHRCSLSWGRQTGQWEGVSVNLPAVNNKNRVAAGELSGGGVGFSFSALPPSQSHHHPNQQQEEVLRQGSGMMRAIFLSSRAPTKQSYGGTGVFLPRRAGCPTTDFWKRSETMTARNKPVWLQKHNVGQRQSPTVTMNSRQYHHRQPKQHWTYF